MKERFKEEKTIRKLEFDETAETLVLGDAPEVETDEEAWNLCLQKWRLIVKAEREDKEVERYASESCAFCIKHYPKNCISCPIYEITEKEDCQGTPYYKYTRNKSLQTATKELEFIQSIGEFNDWTEEEEEIEVDQDILEDMRENIQGRVDALKDNVEHYLKELTTAETLERVMEIKRSILLEFVKKIPLGTQACYFCIKTDTECDVCRYGEVHGQCLETNSDYDKVETLRTNLTSAIRDNYHTDEDTY